MSAAMYWQPPPSEREQHRIPADLRRKLAQKYLDQDGSMSTDWVELGSWAVEYLSGLNDAGVEGAKELILAIERYGSVEIQIRR